MSTQTNDPVRAHFDSLDTDKKKELSLLDEPVEAFVKHGAFWYNVPEETIVAGEPKTILVERMAFHGEPVTLYRAADVHRAEKYGALYEEDETPPSLAAAAAASAAETPPPARTDVNLSELDDDELVDWLTGTGQFDGHKPPNAQEVVQSAQDNPELAERLLGAERRAQETARTTVEGGLQKVIDGDGGDQS